ncbi:MAG: Maf family protein [Rhodobacteraceae bacterium]|nr:Maf family protein [Paracoccaceae bacterium]
MLLPLVLASGSSIRGQLLQNANVAFSVQLPRVDEKTIKQSLIAEGVSPRDIADALAEMKARKISEKTPEALVLGSDQVLEFEGALLSKPQSPDEALKQLKSMRSKRHRLFSAAVICEDGRPVWRHVGRVTLQMRDSSDSYLHDYVDRNWPEIGHAVGAYMLEQEGVRLFSRIEGDYFHVLGMPLLEILGYLTVRGIIEQ